MYYEEIILMVAILNKWTLMNWPENSSDYLICVRNTILFSLEPANQMKMPLISISGTDLLILIKRIYYLQAYN